MPPIPRGYHSAGLGCLFILSYRRPGQTEELGIELAAGMLAKAAGRRDHLSPGRATGIAYLLLEPGKATA